MNENFKINVMDNTVFIIIPSEEFKIENEQIYLSDNPSVAKEKLRNLGISSSEISYEEPGYRRPYVIKYYNTSTIDTSSKYISKLVQIQNELRNLEKKGFEILNKKEFLKNLKAAKKNLSNLQHKKERQILEGKATYLITKMSDDEIGIMIEKFSKK